nr:hypothetical protein [uncultured Duganella sp.]
MSTKLKGGVTARYRWMVLSRLLAATVGSYVVASLFGALTAFGLPMVSGLTLADGVVIGTMLGFVAHAGLFVFAFSPMRAGRVWVWLLGAALVMAVMLWATGGNALFPPAPH